MLYIQIRLYHIADFYNQNHKLSTGFVNRIRYAKIKVGKKIGPLVKRAIQGEY